MMKHATKLILVTLAGITLFAAVPAMAEEAPVHLKWYVGGSAPQSDVDTVAAAMSDYVNEKYGLNIELEITCVDFGSYPDKMQMVIASGEEYDLCWTSSWCNNYYVNVGKNAYLPLDELLKEYGQDMMAEIPKGVWEGARVSGSIYAVPSWQIESKREGLVFPKSYVEEFGVDVSSIHKLADLEDYLYAVKEKYPDLYPLEYDGHDIVNTFLSMDMLEIVDYYVPGVVHPTGDDHTVFSQYESEEYIANLRLLYKWVQDGIIREDAVTVEESGVKDIAAGMHAVTINHYKPGDEQNFKQIWGEEVEFAFLSDAVASTSAVVSMLNAVSVTSKHPEMAIQFLNILNTDADLFNMVCFGIKGVHYNLNEDGTATPIGGAGYDPNTDWVFGNQFLAYPREGQDADIWERTKEVDENAVTAWNMGFAFDTEPVSTEIAACRAVAQQYAGLLCGNMDPDTVIPELVEKLKDAGSDEVLAEMQRQLDEWYATR